jgi:hypothetical protein
MSKKQIRINLYLICSLWRGFASMPTMPEQSQNQVRLAEDSIGNCTQCLSNFYQIFRLYYKLNYKLNELIRKHLKIQFSLVKA